MAALREIVEEVGLNVVLIDVSDLPRWSRSGNSRLPQPIALIEEQIPNDSQSNLAYIDIVFVGLANSARFSLSAEILEAGWFDRPALCQLDTTFPIQGLAAEVFDQIEELRNDHYTRGVFSKSV